MKRLTLYTLLACSVALSSCKKHELPKQEDDAPPVFYLKGDVNGVPVNIQAGVDGYYMNALHYQENNNLYVYKGELKQNACSSNCGFGLTVLINDYKYSAANASMDVSSGLKAGSYLFNDGNNTPVLYNGSFAPLTSVTGGQYDWYFSDGAVFRTEQVSRAFNANTTYTVRLASNDPKGCSTVHTSVFRVGNPLQTNILCDYNSGQYTFYADSGISSLVPYTYLWDFGDGFESAQARPTHAYSMQGYYTVKLTLKDANQNVTESYYQVNNGNYCDANFTGSFIPVQNVKTLSTITVLVTDPNGTVYSSSDLKQPTTSNFEIVSVEDYKMNEQSEPTKKIKIRFTCKLNSSSGPIVINNGEAVLAVSFK